MSPSPTTCPSPTDRSTSRCRPSCSSSSRTGSGRFARLAASSRPGGVFGWISWLTGSGAWPPDDDFDDALLDVGEEARDWEDRSDDLLTSPRPSPRCAGRATRTCGRRAGDLVHPFDVDGAIGFLTEFDEDDLVTSLGDRRPAFEAALRRRLARRPAAELALANRTVTVRGIRR